MADMDTRTETEVTPRVTFSVHAETRKRLHRSSSAQVTVTATPCSTAALITDTVTEDTTMEDTDTATEDTVMMNTLTVTEDMDIATEDTRNLPVLVRLTSDLSLFSVVGFFFFIGAGNSLPDAHPKMCSYIDVPAASGRS